MRTRIIVKTKEKNNAVPQKVVSVKKGKITTYDGFTKDEKE